MEMPERSARSLGFVPGGGKDFLVLAATRPGPITADCRSDITTETSSSARDDEVDGLRPLALLVGLHIEGDALALVEQFQTRALHRCDVNKHVASAVVRLDEAIAAFAIEEFDRSGHCHRETPPRGCSAVDPHGATARLGHSPTGKASACFGLGNTAASRGRWNVKAPADTNIQVGAVKRPEKLLTCAGDPIDFGPAAGSRAKNHSQPAEQLRKLIGQPPRRVHDNQAGAAEAGGGAGGGAVGARGAGPPGGDAGP